MRGVPGSTKSTTARQIRDDAVECGLSVAICSADDYFCLETGAYQYSHDRIGEAHDWCQDRFDEAIRAGCDLVIVDNCNTRASSMRPYARKARGAGYDVEIVEPKPPWHNDLDAHVEKTIHSVPRESIRRMMDRYEHGLTVEELLK